MEAERKLHGAAYHLQRMEEWYLKNDEYFIYELEAF
jgi:ribosomal 30S subunit maturation factor RimM